MNLIQVFSISILVFAVLSIAVAAFLFWKVMPLIKEFTRAVKVLCYMCDQANKVFSNEDFPVMMEHIKASRPGFTMCNGKAIPNSEIDHDY
jgi:hypothetical protein